MGESQRWPTSTMSVITLILNAAGERVLWPTICFGCFRSALAVMNHNHFSNSCMLLQWLKDEGLGFGYMSLLIKAIQTLSLIHHLHLWLRSRQWLVQLNLTQGSGFFFSLIFKAKQIKAVWSTQVELLVMTPSS